MKNDRVYSFFRKRKLSFFFSFLEFGDFLVVFVDAACGVNQFLRPGIERVAA